MSSLQFRFLVVLCLALLLLASTVSSLGFSVDQVNSYEELNFQVVGASLRSRKSSSSSSPSIFGVPSHFSASFPFAGKVYALDFELSLKQIYDNGRIPMVMFAAKDIKVDGVVVPDSFCNVQLHSLQPLVFQGHLSVADDFFLIKPIKGSSGQWERTVIYDNKDVKRDAASADLHTGCGVEDHHYAASPGAQVAGILPLPRRDKRFVVNGTMALFELGIFADCSFISNHGNDLAAAVSDITQAISFANSKFGSHYYLNMFVRPDNLLLNGTCTSGPGAACNSSATIGNTLTIFQSWTASSVPPSRKIWVKLTACYQPQIGVPTAVGLAYVGAFCSIYSNVVVSRVSDDLGFYITFTHELGHNFNSSHDSQGNVCPTSQFIMSAVTPNSALNTITFSSCTDNSIAQFLQTAGVDNCILPYYQNAISVVTPTKVGAGVTQKLTLTFTGSFVTGTSKLGFSLSGDCLTDIIAPSQITSVNVTMSVGIAVAGVYHLCYSDDNGVNYFIQSSGATITVAAASATSITQISPAIAVSGALTTLTFTGLVPTPTATIAFSTALDCSGAVSATVYSSSTSDNVNIPAPGVYYICYSQNGVTFLRQTAASLSLTSITATSASVADLTPSVMAINAVTPLLTSSKIYTSRSRIAFSLTGCTIPELVAISPLLSPVFNVDLSLVSTPGVYIICFSVDSGTTYVQQVLTQNIAGLPSAPLNLGLQLASPSQLTLNWTVPASSNFGPIDSYTITLAPQSNLSDTTTGTTNMTSFKFISLTGQTSYSIFVQARNVAGLGPASSTFTISTSPYSPPDPPVFSYRNNTARTITIHWTAPVETGGLLVLGYNVLIVTPAATTSVFVTGTSCTFTGLEPGQSYAYSIQAVNSQGNSTIFSSFQSTQYADVPTAPRSLTQGSASTTSVSLIWSPPLTSNNASVTAYKVYINATDGSNTTVMTVTETKADVTGLVPGNTYTVNVRAQNEVGLSPPSDTVTTTTTADLLGTINAWINSHLAIFISAVVCGFLLILGLVLLLAWALSRRKQKRLERERHSKNLDNMYDLR